MAKRRPPCHSVLLTQRISSNVIFMICIYLSICSFILVSSRKAHSSLYDVLNVHKTCSERELKKAYHKKCLEHHPDKGGDPETFKEISKAYETLSDPEKRKFYDQYGQVDVDPSAFSGSSGMPNFGSSKNVPNFGSEFFSQFYGNDGSGGGGASQFFGRSARPTKSGGFHINLEDLLRQMMSGGPNTSGRSEHQKYPYNSGLYHHQETKVYTRPVQCSLEELFVGATKRLKVNFGGGRHRIYKVKLKPGWKEGTKVSFKAMQGFPSITFVVKQKKHSTLVRQGDDLIFRYRLPSLARKKHVQIEITLPDGEVWKRSVPTSSTLLRRGQKLTVPQKGMPIKGGPNRGNLIIEFV